MSAIDQYKHRLLGFTECPSSFEIIYSNPIRKVAIYELLEDIPSDEDNFDGKIGDIILGGGRGEVPAFRVAIPEAIYFFIGDNWANSNSQEDLFKPFWTPTQSYKLCEGYAKLGWTTDNEIEFWLAENLCLLLLNKLNSFAKYRNKALTKSKLTFYKVDEL